jgi:hypothetical protein
MRTRLTRLVAVAVMVVSRSEHAELTFSHRRVSDSRVY